MDSKMYGYENADEYVDDTDFSDLQMPSFQHVTKNPVIITERSPLVLCEEVISPQLGSRKSDGISVIAQALPQTTQSLSVVVDSPLPIILGFPLDRTEKEKIFNKFPAMLYVKRSIVPLSSMYSFTFGNGQVAAFTRSDKPKYDANIEIIATPLCVIKVVVSSSWKLSPYVLTPMCETMVVEQLIMERSSCSNLFPPVLSGRLVPVGHEDKFAIDRKLPPCFFRNIPSLNFFPEKELKFSKYDCIVASRARYRRGILFGSWESCFPDEFLYSKNFPP